MNYFIRRSLLWAQVLLSGYMTYIFGSAMATDIQFGFAVVLLLTFLNRFSKLFEPNE